jgi:hypothetical protein
MNDMVAMLLNTLDTIAAKDPQSSTCGPAAPDVCENGCIGCVARAALDNAKFQLESLRYENA